MLHNKIYITKSTLEGRLVNCPKTFHFPLSFDHIYILAIVSSFIFLSFFFQIYHFMNTTQVSVFFSASLLSTKPHALSKFGHAQGIAPVCKTVLFSRHPC